ncbi:unnamed protein product [Caenorhabditis bovis]|uniref:PDZ domain-containing protein n=1 Tax=Caenorhabditis bovis TaxID=2654633 RepID=A0A8S1E7R4_9PELO|nr:unnamed protein product [Caenorhabditis bovis]
MILSPGAREAVFSYETRAGLCSSPFRADDLSDISFAAEATDDMSMNTTQNDDNDDGYEHRNDPESVLKVIEVEKTGNGFGFNIVGGTDDTHYKDAMGFYVSSVNPNSKSYGLIEKGDKILSLDSVDMTNKTHNEAVDIFRSVPVGSVVKMLIDRNPDALFLFQNDRTQTPTPSSTSYQEYMNRRRSDSRAGSVSIPSSETRGRLTPHGLAAIADRLRGKYSYDDEDIQSVTSYAPSTHSVIDDVPRTPRKSLSILDPRNNSMFTEILYVSVGLGALAVTGFAIYRFLRQKN